VILTSLVVAGNDWARALVGRPGVHVADRPQAVLDVVDQLIGEPAAVGAALSRLAPS
jgi:DNA processing protein